MPYDPKIHHRKSIRLKGYDYSQEGLYFITVCVDERRCLFGEVVGDEMVLNDLGKIVDECWLNIPAHFPNAVLHDHIVMPNHVHGIIELTQNDVGIVGAENVPIVGAENFQPLQPRNEFQKMIPRSIGSIVKGFKIGVTKWFNNNPVVIGAEKFPAVGAENFLPLRPKLWQRNYHDHIIRNERSYLRISDYIVTNPAKWADDKFYGRG